MTNRLQYPQYWAQNGVAKDPDTDTTHQSYVANRYASLGWKSEKLPEEWENFLYQITDEKVMNILMDGLPYFDSSVSYKNGAVYRNGDKFYVVEGGVAKETMATTTTLFNQLVAAANKLLSDHLAASNPHKDTVNTLVDKSYIKTDVDNFFGSATDPKTIVYHKARVGKVHNETPAQVGTLPVAGGTFTGQVGFLNQMKLGSAPNKVVQLNKATGILEIVQGGFFFGLDAAGNVWAQLGPAPTTKVMTENNYNDFNIAQGYNFALPVPFVSMNIAQDLSDGDSSGLWTIDTTSAPAFAAGKGYTVAAGTTLSGVSAPANATLVVRGWDATAAKMAVVDVAATTYSTLADLITASGITFVNIAQVWIYPRLTSQQKSMLVTK